MKTSEIARFALAACLLISIAPTASAEDLWISPDGADDNPGTEARPFATPRQALRAVRDLISQGLTSDVVVRVGAGRYELPTPLRFGSG